MIEGSGIKKFFANNWEPMVLWAILIGFFYLLKPFFLLIFEIFLITFITKSLVQRIVTRTNLNYRLTTVMVFLLFISLLGVIGTWIGPRLIIESNQVVTDFAGNSNKQTRENINRFAEKLVVNMVGEQKAQVVIGSEKYVAMIEALRTEASKAVTATLPQIFEALLFLVKLGWKIVISLFLAIIFSFVLVMDWQRIADKMKVLERSRIRTFYLGIAPHLRAFTNVLGKALRAQAIIATCNTILTAIGLWFFDVPNIVLLSTVVFFCGFIPILGTFLSSIPILIFGLHVGGLSLILKLIVLITVVHSIEAYVLNPKITANILHIHPMLVLVLLLIGERFFGIWGMVVGVPIGYYIISVLMTKDEGITEESPERPSG